MLLAAVNFDIGRPT